MVFTKTINEIKEISRSFTSLRTLLKLGVLVYGLVCFAPLSAMACGYHDSLETRISMLNWWYPNCLHVRSEIWDAQALGKVPGYETVSYQETERVLKVLGSRFSKLNPDGHAQRFSMVLVETVLWSQFDLNGSQYKMTVDTDGPIVGELVAVTDEPVIYALEMEELSLSMAVESGLVKLYGDPEQVDKFMDVYGAIGTHKPASFFNFLTRLFSE